MRPTQGATPAVSFTGASKAYGDVRAVDGVDLDIERGETVALLGLCPPDGGTWSCSAGLRSVPCAQGEGSRHP
ncbi:hypothetical protein [Streptomyces sp. NPDC020571]|uniref:hypothetical protein n=1 Tax=Streptomyces sp. NPDC020571 TaxID=3365079 RepID=UPI0037A6FF58